MVLFVLVGWVCKAPKFDNFGPGFCPQGPRQRPTGTGYPGTWVTLYPTQTQNIFQYPISNQLIFKIKL